MRRIRRIFFSLCADRRGSVAWLMAAAIVPIVAAIGLSVDGARGWLVKSRLSQAIDAAGLAGGRVMSSPNRDSDIAMFFNANFPANFMKASVDGPHIHVDTDLTTISIDASATLPTTFMRVVGVNEIRVRASTVVKKMDRGMELVLVMDNTGSMHETASGSTPKITAMKDAATTLINRLYGSRETVPTLWVGLVPYAAIVNVGKDNIAWTKQRTVTSVPVTASAIINNEDSGSPVTSITVCMTTNGHPFWDGALVDISGATGTSAAIYNRRHLVRTVTTKANDGSPTECSITDKTKKFWFVVETSSATPTAAPGGTMSATLPPSDYTGAVNSSGVNVGWGGCVEARATNNYEEEAAETVPGDSSKQWVRAFWPSTRNIKFFNANKRKIARYTPPNAGQSAAAPTTHSSARDGDNDWGADMTPKVVEAVWDYWAYGPNFGCPSAITPLQPNKSTVLTAISNMAPIGRSGTMANVGLAWGWRALSPNFRPDPYHWFGSPANLPLDYNTPLMSKVVILLTDGQNLWNDMGDVAPGTSGITSAGDSDSGLPADGDYTAYSRLSERRLGSTIADNGAAKTEINARMSRLCTSMKQAGVIIYTIILQENDTATKNLYKACASSPSSAYAYFSPTTAELNGIFSEIATQLANLRLAQ